MSIYYLATGTAITSLAALITFFVLFIKTTNSAIYSIENNASSGSGDNDDGNNNDDDNHWYDRENFDLKREDQATIKIALNAFVVCIACATLFVPMVRIWHPSKGIYDRFNLGVLAASTFLVANVLFVSFWYSADFVQEENEDGNNDDDGNNNNNGDDGNNYDDNYEMDQEELLAHHQKLISISSLVFALAFSALSICIYAVGKKLPETGRHHNHDSSSSSSSSRNNNNGETTTTTMYAQAISAAHMELFNEMWKWLSTCTVAIFSILFLITGILSLGEDAERRNEEGGAINQIIILLWMIMVSTGILITGRNILGANKWNGTLGVGLLSGGTMHFALLLFVVFVLYFNVEGRGEEGAGLAISFACLVLSIVYLAFSMGVYKYQYSFLGGIVREKEDDSVDDDSSRSNNGDFQRMEDESVAESRGMELT